MEKEEEGDTQPAPWKELLLDFTQETTLHGIRFPTTKQSHVLRRLIWGVILFAASVLLVYIISTNLVKYFKHPKAVNVDVTYKDMLPFPAITLCNQNHFRSSGIFQEGMYDVLTDHFDPPPEGGKCADSFTYTDDVCPSIRQVIEAAAGTLDSNDYVNVSLRVCEQLCSDAYSSICTAILYDRKQKECLLASNKLIRNPDVISAAEVDCSTSRFELYIRHRCIGKGRELMTCDFEDVKWGLGCRLTVDTSEKEKFELVKMAAISPPPTPTDHTFGSEKGHVIVLGKTGIRSRYTAQLVNDYRYYTNMCMELWYRQLVADTAITFKVIKVIGQAMREELITTTQAQTTDTPSWNRMFVELPDGGYILTLMTSRPRSSQGKQSGVMVDDISIWPCERYRRNCVTSKEKWAFEGLTEKTSSGTPCLQWSDVFKHTQHKLSPKQTALREKFTAQAGRSCRIPPPGITKMGFHDDLWCFTGSVSKPEADPCTVAYCPCRLGQFRCETSGLCIPKVLKCDGKKDCEDLSDENQFNCKMQRSVTCSFEDFYMCGYTSSTEYPVTWRRKTVSNVLNEAVDVFITHSESSLQYVLDLDSTTSNEGDRAKLTSPRWEVRDQGQCLRLWVHMVYHKMDTEQVLLVSMATPDGDSTVLTTIRYNTHNKWIKHLLPVPIGNFTFIFEGTIGFSYRSDISIDDIHVEPCSLESSRRRRNTDQFQSSKSRLSAQEAIDCTFDEGTCNYTFEDTSSFAAWRRLSRTALDNPVPVVKAKKGVKCVRTVQQTEGRLQSDKFPGFYPRGSCTWVLLAPPGYHVTLLLQQVDVGKEVAANCSSDNIVISGATQVYPAPTDPALQTTVICGRKQNISFESTSNELNFTFNALVRSTSYFGYRAKYHMLKDNNATTANAPGDFVLVSDMALVKGKSPRQMRLVSALLHPLAGEACLRLDVYGGPVAVRGYSQPDPAAPAAQADLLAINRRFLGWVQLQARVPSGVERTEVIGFTSGVALDNIAIAHEPCQVPQAEVDSTVPLLCDFINSMCQFADVSTSANMWIRVDGTSSSKDGDNYDYEDDTGSGSGGQDYHYYEADYDDSPGGESGSGSGQVEPHRRKRALPKDSAVLADLDLSADLDFPAGPDMSADPDMSSDPYMSAGIDMSLAPSGRHRRSASNTSPKVLLACEAAKLLNQPCSLRSPVLHGEVARCATFRTRGNGHFMLSTTVFDTSGTTIGEKDTSVDESNEWQDCHVDLQGGSLYVVLSTVVSTEETTRVEVHSINITVGACPTSSSDGAENNYDYDNGDSPQTDGTSPQEGSSQQADENSTITDSEGNMDSVQNPETANRVARQAPSPQPDVKEDMKYEDITGNGVIYLTNDIKTLRKNVAKTMTVDVLQRKASHKVEDFIFSCNWQSKPCDMTLFTPEVTELGVCYTFNGNASNIQSTNLTGSFNGLSLVLNVEKYDHSKGVNSDAGIKFHLRNQSDVSSVSDTGIAVGLSTHTLVEMKYGRTRSLSNPYGLCESKELKFYPQTAYTYSRCQQQCRTQQLFHTCGCRDAFMPAKSTYPICTMEDYLSCVLPFYASSASSRQVFECEPCPAACDVINFGTQMSFASLSELSALELLDSNSKTSRLLRRFFVCQENSVRANPAFLVRTVQQLQSVILGLETLLNYATKNAPISSLSFSKFASQAIQQIIIIIASDMQKTLQEPMISLISHYDISYGWAIRNLLRAMEKVGDNMNMHILEIKDRPVQNRALFINFNMETFPIKSNELANLVLAVKDDDPVIRYHRRHLNYVPRRLYVNPSVATKCDKARMSMLEKSEAFQGKIQSKITENNEAIKFSRNELRELLTIYYEYIGSMNTLSDCLTVYRRMLGDIQDWLRKNVFITGKSQVLTADLHTSFNMELLNSELTAQLKNFRSLHREYSLNTISHMKLSENIDDRLSETIDMLLATYEQGLIEKYMKKVNVVVQTVKEQVLATYQTALGHLMQLSIHFEPMASNVSFELKAREMNIWRKPYTRPNSLQPVQYLYPKNKVYKVWPRSRNLASFTINNGSQVVLKYITSLYFNSIEDVLEEFKTTITDKTKQLNKKIKNLVLDMEKFQDASQIDAQFVVQNFLKLDVYFGELKYEFIEQSPSYVMIDFFSDLGGYMGLLLGASVMTVCEVFDLFLYQGLAKLMSTGKRVRQVSASKRRASVEGWQAEKP